MSNSLDADEVGIIKTMLTLQPTLTYQEILAYFTRPGRDINHARISEIKGGITWAWVPPAQVAATLAFMSARKSALSDNERLLARERWANGHRASDRCAAVDVLACRPRAFYVRPF